ncbi:MAG: ester cyclase [Chloroflexota bacterium]
MSTKEDGKRTRDENSLAKNNPTTDVEIASVPYTDISKLMAPGTQKRQPMTGFDEDYVDIVDYIVRCTHKIWEERGVGLIYTHYGHNIAIHTTDGTVYGRDRVIADSLKTMNAFPDVRLIADDVIWSGNDVDGYHSSHRISWLGRNTGYSIYGPPTGRRVQRYGVAHCLVNENRVVEEWICRDELALVNQLGYDPHQLAHAMIQKMIDSGQTPPIPDIPGESGRLRGQMQPEDPPQSVDENDVEGFVRRAFHEIWNWRLLNKLQEYYVPNYMAFVPPYRKLYGRGDYMAWILARMGAFSDLALTVDHICYLGNMQKGRVATRWHIQGTHDGPGWYGEPTGNPTFLMGITHQEIENGLFVREWSCFDEFALLKQITWPR